MLVGKSAAKFFRTISGSQMGSQLLQNTQIVKDTDVLLRKSEENMDLSRIYLAVLGMYNFGFRA